MTPEEARRLDRILIFAFLLIAGLAFAAGLAWRH